MERSDFQVTTVLNVCMTSLGHGTFTTVKKNKNKIIFLATIQGTCFYALSKLAIEV